MPKVVPSLRRSRAQQQQQQAQQPQQTHHQAMNHTNILLNGPRKVSFEDGHQSLASFSSSSFSSSHQVTCSTASSSCSSISSSITSTTSSKTSLRRKAPSVCLVGLASSDDVAGASSSETEQQCLSPVPGTDCVMEEEGNRTAPSSPWGHFVDILVPLDEHSEDQDSHKRPLTSAEDAPPLFGFLDTASTHSSNGADWSPIFQPRPFKKHKHHRRCWTSPAPHPYGLLPRHHRRRRLRSASTNTATTTLQQSFVPGFFLEDSSTPSFVDRSSESSETKDVEKALQRLQV